MENETSLGTEKMNNLRMMIVSHPGTWQRALLKSIEAYPFVKVVEVVSGSLSAVQLVDKHHPELLLIDSSIPFEDAIALVQKVKRENHGTRSIVITDTTQERRRVIRAGADYTLSSFDFDSQISGILDQLKGMHSDAAGSSETTVNIDPRQSD